MNRAQIIARIRSEADVLRAKGVVHLALFGSRMRGDNRPDSDLDVIVDIDPEIPKFSLLDLAAVCSLIENLTDIQTNAVERPMLVRSPAFASRIADDVVEVF